MVSHSYLPSRRAQAFDVSIPVRKSPTRRNSYEKQSHQQRPHHRYLTSTPQHPFLSSTNTSTHTHHGSPILCPIHPPLFAPPSPSHLLPPQFHPLGPSEPLLHPARRRLARRRHGHPSRPRLHRRRLFPTTIDNINRQPRLHKPARSHEEKRRHEHRRRFRIRPQTLEQTQCRLRARRRYPQRR